LDKLRPNQEHRLKRDAVPQPKRPQLPQLPQAQKNAAKKLGPAAEQAEHESVNVLYRTIEGHSRDKY
jgi:hypothetical protein